MDHVVHAGVMDTSANPAPEARFSISVETPDPTTVASIRTLLEPTYWTVGTPRERIDRALRHSTVLLVARDESRRVVGAARALSDYGRRAMIFDVIVADSHRHQGIGRAMMATLLEHEALRDTAVVWLATRDKRAFYERFGFVASPHASPRPDGNTEMTLRR